MTPLPQRAIASNPLIPQPLAKLSLPGLLDRNFRSGSCVSCKVSNPVLILEPKYIYVYKRNCIHSIMEHGKNRGKLGHKYRHLGIRRAEILSGEGNKLYTLFRQCKIKEQYLCRKVSFTGSDMVSAAYSCTTMNIQTRKSNSSLVQGNYSTLLYSSPALAYVTVT